MNDLIIIDDLISEYIGDRVREKKYKANYKGTVIEAVTWCVWLEKKYKWSKWHVSYRLGGTTNYYDDPFEMTKFITEMHLTK